MLPRPKSNRNAALANEPIGSRLRRVAYLERTKRVGRSQGASIFWGLISVCFAAAASYYYWKNVGNETTANVMRDEVLQLREENETLNSQKEHLQASATEEENQLKTREDLVEEKETELAAEESHLDTTTQQAELKSEQNLAQVEGVKKFNDTILKLSKENPPDVVERGGRPVLRVPNADLFAPGDAALTPAGKAMLTQLALALNGAIDNFELRVVAYTDSGAEGGPDSAQKKDPAAGAKPHYATSWDLTAARASTLARFLRDQTQLPFLNVLVIGRGDSEPIVPNASPDPSRNRRVEITITPLPVAFRAPDTSVTSSTDPLAPPPDAPAPPHKAKEKKTGQGQ